MEKYRKKSAAFLKFGLMVLILLSGSIFGSAEESGLALEDDGIRLIETTVASTQREGVQIPAFITQPGSYDENGSYPLVVMLHGHGVNHNEFGGYDAISNELAENGFLVATLDFPGCGDSTESFRQNTVPNMEADTLDVIRYVTENYAVDEDRIGGFGYSMGGRVVLEMIAEDPGDFAAIELVAPAVDAEDMKNLFVEADSWEEMEAEAQENGYAELTTTYDGSKQELGYDWFLDLEENQDLVERAAQAYDGTSLVIWSFDDELVKPSVSEELAEALGSIVINTYTDGHSYSFSGSDEYTVSTVNSASVHFFVDELGSGREEGAQEEEEGISGYLRSIDKYGNLLLTISEEELIDAGYEYGDVVTVTIDGMDWEMPYCTAYAEVDYGEPLLRAADGELNVALNSRSFAVQNGIADLQTTEEYGNEYYYLIDVPAVVTISMAEKGGYYNDWLMRQIEYTNEREDYADLSDEEFANFRSIDTAGMGKNALYRSSSPINPGIGRSACADLAMEAAGIRTAVNLADSQEKAYAYEGFDETYYAGQKVIYLNLGVDYTEESFQTGLREGLRFLTENDGPYLIHCSEGKDRAGFVCALLECFMGASCEEVIADYMTTFENYYGVEKGSEQYDYLASNNIVKSLQSVFDTDDLAGEDLEQDAEEYFRSIGLTDEELVTLREKLGADY